MDLSEFLEKARALYEDWRMNPSETDAEESLRELGELLRYPYGPGGMLPPSEP